MTRVRRIATALIVGAAVLSGPIALAYCVAACEQPIAHTALKLPPCHHHDHHRMSASTPVAPTVRAVIATVAATSHHLDISTVVRTSAPAARLSPQRIFDRPLRI
ncbi:MAG TPA: hypothetical protein VFA59_11930 [Vicinamibacterales bacterium]|nr:hypothetical protein [Vicinamibacterales bacterium]